MDVTGIEATEPIFELATECETLFSDHLSRLKNESDFNGAKVIGEYQQRFSAWAAFLGVFAVPVMCLDRRLRSHAEIQDLVLRLLDIMKRNLVHLLEEDIDIPDSDQATSPQIRVNLESLRGIEGAVDRLNHLGRTIQRSSEAGQASKVDEFTTTFDSTPFEEIARIAVKSFYPDASASLLNQIVQAMTDMYEKFHYRRSRLERLQARPKTALFTIGEEPASDPPVNTPTAPPVLDANKQLPRLMSTTHLEERSHKSKESKPTSLDSREFNRLISRQGGGSVGSKTRSILVSQVAYPQPSEESVRCEWCFATLSKDELKGEKWKKHVNEDFKPFICISEKCTGQANRFATSRAWFSHMLETHGQNWHREIHLPVWWVCPLCNSKETTFSRAQDLSEHISKLHDDLFTNPQIQVIVHQSQLRSPRPQDMCPLCCLSMRDEQDKGKEEQHLKVALPDFSLKHPTPGESRKRVKTETGLIKKIGNSDVGYEGEIKETAPNAGTQSAQNTQRVNIEAIARHVAAHLQGIMLFTLRMMSLDVPNATIDEKSLSGSTDHDSSRTVSEQQRFEQETDAISDMLEEQADSLEVGDPIREFTIAQRSNKDLNQAQRLRHELKRLGSVELPSEDARQDAFEIYNTINNPHPRNMSDGIIYIYKHTSISGIFEIGCSRKSALSRHKSGNGHGIDTTIIYQTEKTFAGAFQAHRIIHAVLRHREIRIHKCSYCGSGHRGWFLTSGKEALKIVQCAESWLQMPAYTIHQGKVKLLPKAEVIYGSMFVFSLGVFSWLINTNNAPDDTSDVFSVSQLAAATEEISKPNLVSFATRNRSHTKQAGRTSTTTLPIQPGEQISPIRRAANALQTMDLDTIEELTRVRPLRSAHLDSDEDYNNDEGPQESDSGEDYSEVESEELENDEEYIEYIEHGESEDFDSDEEDVKDEESQELGSDEESREAEEPQERYIDEDHNQVSGSRVRTRRQPPKATSDVDINVVKILKAVRLGGAVEFRDIFPQDL